MRGFQGIVIVFSIAILTLSIIFAYRINGGKEVIVSKNIVVDSSGIHRLELDSKKDTLKGDPVTRLADLNESVSKPADSTQLSWDLVDPGFRKSVVLVLQFDSPDRFQRACLSNFLNSNNIEHSEVKDSNLHIRLKTKEIERANEIIKELATYDLAASLEILRESKPY